MTIAQAQRQQVQLLLRNYRESAVLIACAELRVFEELGDGWSDVLSLAQALDVNGEALARLLNGATALGLLVKQDGRFANSALALACLTLQGEAYLGNLVRREAAFYQRWSRLAEAVRTGSRPEENRRDESDNSWVRDFQLALLDVARFTSPLVVEALKPFVAAIERRPMRLIDVGGGHGGYAHAMARAFGAEAQVFDLPASIEVARTLIPPDLEGRITMRAGDFRVDDLGSDFDMALLFGVLVSETETDAIALLKKIFAALDVGAYIVVRGMYLNVDRAGPPDTTLFDLHMLLSTQAGGLHTYADVTRWLRTAGFASPQIVPLHDSREGTLVVAQKSGER
jgi:O-methyltransferase/methyltransferase family protein